MNFKINYLLPLMIILSGCDFGNKEDSNISDAELIQMILSASKVEIDMNDLPTGSKVIIDTYIEYDGLAAHIASDLGYEVELAGNGFKCGKRNEIFFNLEGRQLDPNDWGENRNKWTDDNLNKEDYDNDDWRCFEILFPVSFNMPNGSIVEVMSDDEEGWSDIKNWYQENPNSDDKPILVFPIMIFYDEESVMINDNEELRDAYSECRPKREDDWLEQDRRRNQCFELVYPVNYVMPDGSIIEVVSDHEESWSDIKNWYEQNSGYEESRPVLQYPVDILYETEDSNSRIVTVNNEGEMNAAKDECREEWEEGLDRDCFDLILPVSYIMPDGSIITVTDDGEFMAIRNWYEENEGDYEEPVLQYPVDILYETEDGDSLVTLNSEEEMRYAKSECWHGEEEEWEDEEDCFQLVLPVNYVMPDGSTITVEDEEGYVLLRNWYEENEGDYEEPVLQYPVDILYETEDGDSLVTLNSEEEMRAAYAECLGEPDRP